MEQKTSLATSDLIDFNFYQLVEILSKKYNFNVENIECELMEDSLFMFSSNPLINFPTSDVERINVKDNNEINQIEIIVNFLGLHGANGPLPGAVLNEIAYEFHNQDNIKNTYLDFFNHHFISLLHAIWRKYKYYIHFKENASDNYSQKILALIGVNNKHLKNVKIDWTKLLFYIGLIQTKVRTTGVLSDIIRYYFDLDMVTIDEWQRQLINIDKEQRNQLGKKNMMLGDSFVIGEVITSFTNKFTINIHNLNTELFHQFLPSGKKYAELIEIMHFLLEDQLPYDICLGLHPETQSNFVLGSKDDSFLGWSTLLNSDSSQQEQVKRITITGQI